MAFSVTNDFTANTTAVASEVEQNMTDIETELNSFPTDGTLAAGCVDTSQLATDALSADATGRAKMADGFLSADATGRAKMADSFVTSAKIAAGTVAAGDMAAGACWRHDGTQVYNTNAPTSWTDLDLSSYVGSNSALVFLKIKQTESTVTGINFKFRTNGDTEDVGMSYTSAGGCSLINLDENHIGYITIETDTSGVIEWKCSDSSTDTDIWLMGYIK